MSEVWLLTLDEAYAPSMAEAVFSSLEKAQASCPRADTIEWVTDSEGVCHEKTSSSLDARWTIRRFVVDDPDPS